jgi:hypothetical protein
VLWQGKPDNLSPHFGRPDGTQTHLCLWIRALLRRCSKNILIITEIRGLEELKMTPAEKFDRWAEGT